MIRSSRSFRIIARICRIVLACTFVASGFTKVIDPWGTALKINEYLSIYGFERLEPWSMTFSIWLCGAELMMGCMLLFRVRVRMVSIFALLSMVFFTLLTLLSATWIPVEDCGCFGDALKLTPWQTFLKNLVLLPMAFVVWYRYRPDRIFAFKPAEIVCALFFFAFSMGLGTFCYRHLPLIDFLPYKVGVNIWEEMHASASDAGDGGAELRLVYRDRATGREREFALDDPEWQDTTRWEWVATRIDEELPVVEALMSEFSLRDADGDATERILTAPGRVYLVCVTEFDGVGRSCARRLERLVRRAQAEGALAVCLTPEPLSEVTYRSFGDGADSVRCYNIDATVMKTMLRARTGVVVLDDGVIVRKRNCRDVRP